MSVAFTTGRPSRKRRPFAGWRLVRAETWPTSGYPSAVLAPLTRRAVFRTAWLKKIPAVAAVTLGVAAGAVALNAASSAAAPSCSNGYVALTFDDGPTGNTSTLLNVLANAGARATMFNTGSNATNNPSLVRAEQSAGM